MANYADMINQAVYGTKQNSVAAATGQKQAQLDANRGVDPYSAAAMRQTGAGLDTATTNERIAATGSPGEILASFGTQGLENIGQGTRDLTADQTSQRSTPRALADTAIDIGTGAANMIGGLGALAAGTAYSPAGVWAAQQLDSLNKGAQALQSGALNDRRTANAAIDALKKRDNAASVQADRDAGETDLIVGLKEFGRDWLAGTETALADPMTAISGTAQGVGSMLAVGPVGRVLGGAGNAIVSPAERAVLSRAAQMGVGGQGVRAADAVLSRAGTATTSATIGAMEAGGSYTQTVNDVLATPVEKLAKESPLYQRFAQEHPEATPELIRQNVAHQAGLDAAKITAPAAIAAGALVARFEAAPLAGRNLRQVPGNLAREYIEEGAQGSAGQFAQNAAIQMNVNRDQSLLQDVGSAGAESAIYGLGTAGAVQVPGVAREGVGSAVALGGKAAQRALDYAAEKADARAAKVQERNEKASPVADTKIAEAATGAVQNAPAAVETLSQAVEASSMAPEEKLAAVQYTSDLMDSFSFDPTVYDAPDVPESVRSIAAASTNRVSLVQGLSDAITKVQTEQELGDLAFALYDALAPVTSMRNRADGKLLNQLQEDQMSMAILGEYESLAANIDNTPILKAAMGIVQGRMDEIAASVSNPTTQQDVNKVAMVAEQAPEKANVEANRIALEQAENGKLILSPIQRASIKASTALLVAQQKTNEALAAQGFTDPIDLVSNQITTDEVGPESKKSALRHTKEIIAAMRSGNDALASQRLSAFGDFAQHMQNKVAAINEHFASGNPFAPGVPYRALVKGEWKSSAKGMFSNTTKVSSIESNQMVAAEAAFVAEVFEGLRQAWPELNVAHVNPVLLDQGLSGDTAANIHRRIRNEWKASQATRAAETPSPVVEPATAVVEEAPASATEVEAPAADVTPAVEAPSDNVQTEPAPTEVEPKTKTSALAYRTDVIDLITREDSELTPEEEAIVKKIPQNLIDAAYQYRSIQQGLVEAGDVLSGQDLVDAEEAASAKLKELGPKITELYGSIDSMRAAETVQPAPVEEAPAPAPKTVAEAFPGLVKPETNAFTKSFSLTDGSRVSLVPAPMRSVVDALRSVANFEAFTGKPVDRLMSQNMRQAWRKYIAERGTLLRDRIAKNLLNAVRTKGANKQTLAQFYLEDGSIAEDYVRTRVLALTKQDGDSLVYDSNLLETATLAGLQWLMTANTISPTMDTQTVADILDIPEEQVDFELVAFMQQGTNFSEAVRSLGAKISQYWGVRGNRNAPAGDVDGIPQAMALEVINGLVRNGDLQRIEATVNVTLEDGTDVVRDLVRLVPARAYEDRKENPDAKTEFSQAIDQAVLKEVEPVHFIGDVMPPVAKKQLRSATVNNTPEQLAALTNDQQTAYTPSMPTANLWLSFGMKRMQQLFGGGDLESQPFNKNHRKSLEGQNTGVAAGYNGLMDLLSEIEGRGIDLATATVRYAYNFTKVARMQMLGAHNPQSNKAVREVMQPTWSTSDLTDENSQNYQDYLIALAQGLGIKVHNKMPDVAAAEILQKLRSPEFEPAILMFDNFLNSQEEAMPDDAVEVILGAFKAAGLDATAVGFHNALDFARLQQTPMEERKAYRTATYLEADGVTNGPANAMMMLTYGQFTGSWITNTRKIGMFLGTARMTMNQLRSTEDKVDLYEATTNQMTKNLGSMAQELKSAPGGAQMFSAMASLMDEFLPDASLNENGDLVFKRGAAKNPLTITIYGSGEMGIAGKIAGALMDAIYERMSQAAQAQAENPDISDAEALFGEQSTDANDAERRFEAFEDSLKQLMARQVRRDREGVLQVRPFSDFRAHRNESFVDYTFTPAERKALRNNILAMYVEPMRKSIREVLGPAMEITTEALRKATQVQSIILEDIFNKRVQEVLGEKAAKDPKWKPNDFLSQDEVAKILRDLKALHPTISTGTQTFFISAANSREQGVELARGLNNSGSINAFVYGPKDSGVAGIPTLVIGMGDGQMMQTLAADPNGPKQTLKIFDGMNVPFTQMRQYSEQANAAVINSWQNNPMRAVEESFTPFAKNARDLVLSAEALKKLARAAGESKDSSFGQENVRDFIDYVAGEVQDIATSLDARIATLQEVGMWVDQMAGAGAPAFNGGKIDVTGTPDEVAAKLNVIYEKHLAAMTKRDTEKAAEPKEQHDYSELLGDLGRRSATGARVLSSTSLKTILKKLTLPAGQAAVLEEALASNNLKDWKFVVGTREELAEYSTKYGLPTLREDALGMTVPGSKIALISNTETETLAHEVVHVATYQAILDFYQGGQNNLVGTAVENLEKLMMQFLELDGQAKSLTYDLRSSYLNASSAIDGWITNLDYSVAERKAGALNEFMAWGLSNKSLSDLLARNRAPRLAQIAKDIFDRIISMFWGGKKAPKHAQDALSNLQFNSFVVMRGQQDASKMVTDTALFQSVPFGQSDRLSALTDSMSKVIRSYGQFRPQARQSADEAKTLANRLGSLVQANGFTMTPQEATTFSMLVTAMSTEANLDGSSMAKGAELYEHVRSKLTLEHFLDLPGQLNAADRRKARLMYDQVMGFRGTAKDRQDRTTDLPVFLALAMTNEKMREVLRGIPMPESAPKAVTSMDTLLTNAGTAVMSKLSDRMSGVSNPANVQIALDQMVGNLAGLAQERENFIDNALGTVQSFTTRANEILVEGLDALGAKADMTARTLEKGNRLERSAASVMSAFAALTSDERAGAAAEGIMSVTNQSKLWGPVKELLGDLVGRTASNARIYDKIKATRSAVSQYRQQFREDVPRIIDSKFTVKLNEKQRDALFAGLGKTDVAALAADLGVAAAREMISNDKNLKAAIKAAEAEVSAIDSRFAKTRLRKAQELATFMNTGVIPRNLLRNATAVWMLVGEGTARPVDATGVAALDKLISLYAVQSMDPVQRGELGNLLASEQEGVDFALSYLVGQREEEVRKTNSSGRALLNAYKGYIPTRTAENMSMIVADDTEFSNLATMSYERIGAYSGSNAEFSSIKRSYYMTPTNVRSAFSQGLLQNARQTAGGVDLNTGYTYGALTAGVITDRKTVYDMANNHTKARDSVENVMPIFDNFGDVVAFERGVDPSMTARMAVPQDLSSALGIWRGRQVEEAQGSVLNEVLLEEMAAMYDDERGAKSAEYVNVLNSKDPVVRDAVKLLGDAEKAKLEDLFGPGRFMVRKDLVNDVLGYRAASLGDMWTGNSRWSPTTRRHVRNLAIAIGGNKAFAAVVNNEGRWKNLVADAKNIIVVKSVIVPMFNAMSNIYQLIGRGVPVQTIARDLPRKLNEVNQYTKNRLRETELDAELRAAAGDARLEAKLKAQIKSLQDVNSRLSIWPLVQAGEFTAISDATLSPEDVALSDGRLYEYIESLVNKLPETVRNAGKYALVTKDTALYQGLQRAVDYGDFLAKAITYDDLTKRKGLSKEEALGRVTEEFVNYDRLPGRFRGGMEGFGLMWFWSFKIRSTKIALSMLRNNPFQSLLSALTPQPQGVGTPIDDNLFSAIIDGRIDNSMGPGQLFRAPTLNPALAIFN